MSAATPSFDFSQFVPGFDFLKQLATTGAAGTSGGAVPGMPSLSSWVAPTLSVEEVDKRIQELKTVQYWLEQNGHALKATIQALEVQKMTLSTLRGMNVRMEDLASAFTRTAAATAAAASTPDASTTSTTSTGSAAPEPAPAASPAPAAPAASAPFGAGFFQTAKAPSPAAGATAGDAAEPDDATHADDTSTAADAPADTAPRNADAAGVVDPLQWWGALTQQFQQIASSALKDAAHIQMPVMPAMPTAPAPRAPAARKPPAAARKPAAGKSPTAATRKKAPAKTPTPRAPAKGR